MALAISVTRGHTFTALLPYNQADLNAAALPTVTISGSVDTAELAAGAVTAAKSLADAHFYADTTGSSNAYIATLANAPSALTDGMWVVLKSNHTNTGAATLNLNSLGVKSIYKRADQELAAGDIKAEQVMLLVYNADANASAGAWIMASTPGQAYTFYAADAGASDAYAITLDYQINAYNDIEGLPVVFKANTANTGGCTLNINSKGAQTILKHGNVTMATGDIKAGQIVTVVWDGSNFQMQAPPGPPSALLDTAFFAAFHHR